MSGEDDRIFERKLGRGEFLKLSALAAAGTSLLAACGGSEEAAAPAEEPASTTPAATTPAATTPATTEEAAPSRPPIEEEPGDLAVFEWAGYEYPTYGGEGGALQPYVDAYGKPSYSFLTSDDQALGKVRAGFAPDVIHPCKSYIPDWVAMEYIQPWDTSLLKNFSQLNPALVEGAKLDGLQYFMPADWGFSSPLYRADKVDVSDGESWAMFYDERYKGKISWWDSPLENFLIWGYVQGFDPYDLANWTDAVLADATKFLTEKKKLVRNFWSTEPDLKADFRNGSVWIAYAWGGTFADAKQAGLDVVYSEPKEGRLSWNCGLVLAKETKNYYHAHAYADAWISKQSGDWIIPNYYYGHANTTVDVEGIDPLLVEAFHLDDPTSLQEPRAHLEQWVPERHRFAKAWEEVRAA